MSPVPFRLRANGGGTFLAKFAGIKSKNFENSNYKTNVIGEWERGAQKELIT